MIELNQRRAACWINKRQRHRSRRRSRTVHPHKWGEEVASQIQSSREKMTRRTTHPNAVGGRGEASTGGAITQRVGGPRTSKAAAGRAATGKWPEVETSTTGSEQAKTTAGVAGAACCRAIAHQTQLSSSSGHGESAGSESGVRSALVLAAAPCVFFTWCWQQPERHPTAEAGGLAEAIGRSV